MNTVHRSSLLLVGAALLAGCAQLKQADDWAMNKVLQDRGQVGQLQPDPWPGVIKVPPEAQCRFTGVYREMDNCCVMGPYTAAVDVDTAFAKARVEYGFKAVRPQDEGRGYNGYHGFVYETTPGAVYRLFGEVSPRSDARLSRGIWMGLVLSKASPTTTAVEPVYCESRGQRMQDQLTWHKAAQESIRATLPPASRTTSP